MLTPKEIKLIARQLAEYLREEQQQDEPKQEYITAEEKAQQLHISVSRLYKIKDQYPHYQPKGRRRLMFLK